MNKLTVLPNSFLTLNYRLTLPSGDDYINTFIDRPATVLIGSGQFAPCFEKVLIGLGVGEKKSAKRKKLQRNLLFPRKRQNS